jgi:RNA polymerase sigma-70 factor (ECF subfamily)
MNWLDRRLNRARRGHVQLDSSADPFEEGNAQVFITLTLVHADALYRTAYHLAGSVVEAEDLTQETYLRAYRGFAGLRGGDIRAWLFTILRHVFLDECRRRKRMSAIAAAGDALTLTANGAGAWVPSAETEALQHLPSETVDRAIASLPPDWRLVLLLADVEDLSYREIAAILEIPLGTVMSRLHRARRRLQDQLGTTRQPGRTSHERSA